MLGWIDPTKGDTVATSTGFFKKFIALDPLLVRGFVMAVIGLLTVTGLVVTEGNQEAILGFVMALLTILTALWGRPAVTPNIKVLAFKPDPIDHPYLIESGNATASLDQVDDVVAASFAKKAT